MTNRLDDDRLHPELRARVQRVLAQMKAEGNEMRVTDGFRTAADQRKLYAKGRTIPPIGKSYRVTNCDGAVNKSHHQSGRSVDCAFWMNGKFSWDARLPWARYGALAVLEGLVWGGHFKSLVDRPHVELPASIKDTAHAPTDSPPAPVTPGPDDCRERPAPGAQPA